MGWKELYKPNIVKLVIPVGLFIFQLYYILSHWGGYFKCRADCYTSFSYAVSSILALLALIILLVYPVVCWVYALINWALNKVKK